jgi:hypothetical protein
VSERRRRLDLISQLIESGEIPGERIGQRRKVSLRDVSDYRERRRQQQYEAIPASEVDIGEDNPQAVLEKLREARRVVAERRRARAASR